MLNIGKTCMNKWVGLEKVKETFWNDTSVALQHLVLMEFSCVKEEVWICLEYWQGMKWVLLTLFTRNTEYVK